MTRAPWVQEKPAKAWAKPGAAYDTSIGWRFTNPRFGDRTTLSMPQTAENVAERYGVSREDQDAFALRSQQRTAAAQARGFFDGEIVAVDVPGRKRGETVTVERDEHPRGDTTAEALAKLKPLFRQPGTVTAGNASGINDGAAALLLASGAQVQALGLTPRARILGFASAGVEPAIMGMGPVPASQKLMARLGLAIADFDAIELNEAFASQGLACMRQLGLADDAAHVNPNGGAIALGHPLGMSGARLALTLLRQLEASGGRRGLATMCIGVGQGVALAIERV
jgi:3-oxoadipyl-CoA thiolase